MFCFFLAGRNSDRITHQLQPPSRLRTHPRPNPHIHPHLLCKRWAISECATNCQNFCSLIDVCYLQAYWPVKEHLACDWTGTQAPISVDTDGFGHLTSLARIEAMSNVPPPSGLSYQVKKKVGISSLVAVDIVFVPRIFVFFISLRANGTKIKRMRLLTGLKPLLGSRLTVLSSMKTY